jgi:hypothetical protein
MSERVSVRIADLLLDQSNARLKEEQPSQPATYRALTALSPKYLLTMAQDIVEKGMDPLSLPAVVATTDKRRRYTVLEGNRRVLAVKALETPSIVQAELSGAQQKRLNELSARFHADPIGEIDCVLFDDEDSARHWIQLRHTGANEGAGTIVWDSDNQDAYRARHGGQRSLAGQVIDFLNRAGSKVETDKISTSITRLMSTPQVREVIGLRLEKGQLKSEYPSEHVIPGLEHIVSDLSSGRIKVADIYEADQRRDYAKGFPKNLQPNAKQRLDAPVSLDELSTAKAAKKPKKSATSKPPKVRKPADATSVVPRTSRISPTHPRLNEVYNELSTLEVDIYPNATSVLLRVFVELSIDHYIDQAGLMPNEQQRRNTKLSEKMRKVAEHLHDSGKIQIELKKVVDNVATGNGHLKPSVAGMHIYLHNMFAYPKPSELRQTWNELEPFLEKL